MILEYMILFSGFIISEILAGCRTTQGNNAVVEIIKVAIPVVVTFIGVFLITRKEKHNKSTEAINKLIRQLGMNDNETLKHGLSSQYNNVMESIGRDGKASLTEQHSHLESCIQENYKTIKDRYKREDDAYALFTSQQRDLAETMNNFTRDYKETINDRNRILIENEKLKEQIKELRTENKMLRDKIDERK